MDVYVYFRWLCNLESNDILKNVEIVVSICALVCAFMAYRESLKARRYSSFETIFSQMLSLQRSFFDNQYMFSKEHRPLTDKFVFNYFFLYKILNNNGNSTLETDHLSNYYKDFVEGINNVEHFKNCFKFIHNIVMLVEKSEIDVKDKQLYIDRIQALLNRNEMFCYFVNLVAHGSKLKDEEKKKHDDYIVLLKNNSFFKDLDDKNGRFNEILSTINSDLLVQFGIKKENRQK